ncbi:MAG: DUF4363 family protein [bacterium]|jgi:hypothetical protein
MEKQKRNKWLVPLCLILLIPSIIFLLHYTIRKPVLDLDLPHTLQATIAALEEENWPEAKTRLEELTNKWNTARPRVLLNGDASSLRDFETALARLDRMVQQENKINALAEIATLQVIWTGFLSF